MEARILPYPTDAEPDDELERALARLRHLVETSAVPEARAFVKELVARWPEDPRVRKWDHVLEPPRVVRREPGRGRSYRQEWDWLKAHAHEYPGMWLLVYEDRLVAADRDPQVIRKIAREHPEWQDPLLHHEPERTE